MAKLRRFSNLIPKLKTTLFKTLLLPIIEYPIISLCITLRKHKKRKQQVVINKDWRFIKCNEVDRLLTVEELHQ